MVFAVSAFREMCSGRKRPDCTTSALRQTKGPALWPAARSADFGASPQTCPGFAEVGSSWVIDELASDTAVRASAQAQLVLETAKSLRLMCEMFGR